MKLRFDSIRQKLFATVLLTTLVALIVSVLTIIAYDLRLYHKNLLLGMTMHAQLIGHMTAPALTFDDPRLAKENLGLLRIRSNVKVAALYTAKGKIFATYTATGEENAFPPVPEIDTLRVEGDNLIIFKPIVNEGVTLGTVYMLVDYGLRARMLDYLAIAAAATLLAMFIAYLMTARLARIVTYPIVSIAKVAQEVVQQRDYSRRAEKISSDEVGTLVDSFNGMLTEIERRTKELEQSSREIAREAEQRGHAQQEVMRLNTELELRVHDRTAQLEIANEELALAKAAADKANQAKSAFLSSMSHELRTPLNAILGFAQLSDSNAIPATAAQKKVFIGHILKAGRHLLTLINEVLDLAKVESGAMALSMEPVALAQVMQESQTMIEPLGNQRGVRLVFPVDTPLHVTADRTRLKQILLNLLSNAIKYNRENGAVVVDCAVISDTQVRISIQDTGEGLMPEQVDSLFQPFNRLGQEGGEEEGTGIGLVVTKRLVEMMGGAIGVTSTVGLGSVFWIDLKITTPPVPFLRTELRSETTSAVSTGDSIVRTLLYIEDNPANLKLVQEILAFRSDIRLLTAPDAQLGIELARLHLPEVILMDINLPGLSGYEAQKILAVDPKTAGIPIIALTANAMPGDVETGLAAGFFRYMTKPLDLDEFTAAIDSALKVSNPGRFTKPAAGLAPGPADMA